VSAHDQLAVRANQIGADGSGLVRPGRCIDAFYDDVRRRLGQDVSINRAER
jgi:hypothetical protein